MERGQLVIETQDGIDRFPQSEIEEVDHPGNVAAMLGALVSVAAVVNFGENVLSCGDGQWLGWSQEGCVRIFAPLVLGFGMVILGVSMWGTSVVAESQSYDASMLDHAVTPVPE